MIKRILLLTMIVLLSGNLTSHSLDFEWTYIPIDDAKQKWGDWDQPEWLRYFGLDFGDVNRDGNIDIISGRYIYQNPGGSMEAPWPRIDLGDNVDAIFFIDADGDPFADIIAQALPNIYWYEAVDKEGTRYTKKLISNIPETSHVNSQGFEKAQITPSGPLELVIASNGNVYCISIPDNPDAVDKWPTNLIAKNTSDEGIGVGDIDNDGDLDIACGRRPEGGDEPLILVWFENPGNVNTHWQDHVVGQTDKPIDRIELGDLNGDSNLEIVISEERYPGLEPDGKLLWFSRQDDIDQTWSKHHVVTQYSMNNLDLADIDNDGDIDIITNEHKGPRLETQLWINDGAAEFTKHILDTGKENHLGSQFVDLDGDGDLDVAGCAWDNYQWMHVWRNDELKTTQAIYEGKPHFVVQTKAATYYYDIEGGGFSRILDIAGADWVSFKRNPWGKYPGSAASSFRGLPNLVWQGEDDGAGHPGHAKCKSWLSGNRIVSESLSGKWRWSWEFFDDHAVLDITKTDMERTYWFLYEGTPGGVFDPAGSYFGTNMSGPLTKTPDFYAKTIMEGRFQWIYAGHNNMNAVFYMAQLKEDNLADVISYLGASDQGVKSEDGMTVFGFGRAKDTKPLLSGPQSFVIGFYPEQIKNESQHERFAEFLNQRLVKF
ncbi:MAG: VCBS repeat-containing protein [Candidatus Hinthialibacter antarcticus]|nr:VCBS repeat-containing protein [Candidatus Hinthialibacter antarcticus]